MPCNYCTGRPAPAPNRAVSAWGQRRWVHRTIRPSTARKRREAAGSHPLWPVPAMRVGSGPRLGARFLPCERLHHIIRLRPLLSTPGDLAATWPGGLALLRSRGGAEAAGGYRGNAARAQRASDGQLRRRKRLGHLWAGWTRSRKCLLQHGLRSEASQLSGGQIQRARVGHLTLRAAGHSGRAAQGPVRCKEDSRVSFALVLL